MKLSYFSLLVLSTLSFITTVLSNPAFNANIIPLIPFLCESSDGLYDDLKIRNYQNIESWVDFINKYMLEKGIRSDLLDGKRATAIKALHLEEADTITDKKEWDCKKIADKFNKNKQYIVKDLDIVKKFSGITNFYSKIEKITKQRPNVINKMIDNASTKMNINSFRQAITAAHEARVVDWLSSIRKGLGKKSIIKDPYYRKALEDINACFKQSVNNEIVNRADEYKAFIDKYKTGYTNGYDSTGKSYITSIEVTYDSDKRGFGISENTGHVKLLKTGNNIHNIISSCRI